MQPLGKLFHPHVGLRIILMNTEVLHKVIAGYYARYLCTLHNVKSAHALLLLFELG